MLKKLFFLFFFGFVKIALGQFLDMPGTPLIKNFSKTDVANNLKVFDISQSKDGEMYFATPQSLLEFDGFRWQNYTAGLESDLRAVLFVDEQHIYTSGHGGFGYWSKNNKGGLEYTSLYFKQPNKLDPLLPVFSKIVAVNKKVYFQSFQEIFVYDSNKNTLDKIEVIKGFNSLFSSANRVFVQDLSAGLFEIVEKEKKLIKGAENFKFTILNVFVQNDKDLLIATKKKGFWFVHNGILTQKKWHINEEIEKHIATDVKRHYKDTFVLGTLRRGFYIISNKGEIILHIDKSNGIAHNSVRTVFNDVNNNVWLGTTKGVSYIQTNGDANYLIDTKGSFGTVYTSLLKDSLLYLGTNQGLFVKNIALPFSEPKLIDKSQEQVWEIAKIDDEILVGSHSGIGKVYNTSLETIHLEGGGWIFKKHPKIEDILYVGFYSGIAVFKKINKEWKFQNMLHGFGESSRFLEFDQYGQIWVAHPSKGYYRLALSIDGMSLKETEFYGINNSNIEVFAYLCKIDGNLVFYNPKGFFYYDVIDNSFTKAKYPSEIFKEIKNINSIYQDNNVFWYSTQKSLGYILRNGNQFNNHQASFYTFWDKHLDDFNKFQKISQNIFGIGIDDGIVFYNIEQHKKSSFSPVPLIKSIELISATDTIAAPVNSKKELKIPYKNNFVKVKIALPNVPLGNSKLVQYQLKGFANDWSRWVHTEEINFPGLSPGNYILKLKAKGENQKDSKIITIPFYIKSPWYSSTTATIVYALNFILVFIFYRTYLNRKNKRYIARLKLLEKQKRQRQKEVFELQKMEADKEVFLLKEENLNLEIKQKSSELALATLNNIKKNELLTDLIADIAKVDKALINDSLHFSLKKLIKKINNHLVDKEDWLAFELHFRNSHSQFFSKLREKHPSLSSNEIKLSAYLKLNLSSKEIAALMNIAISSVEQNRYRLRKKLALTKDENLVKYIQAF